MKNGPGCGLGRKPGETQVCLIPALDESFMLAYLGTSRITRFMYYWTGIERLVKVNW